MGAGGCAPAWGGDGGHCAQTLEFLTESDWPHFFEGAPSKKCYRFKDMPQESDIHALTMSKYTAILLLSHDERLVLV